MGSTVLVMPKLFRSAGLISSIVGTVFMCLLCAYTAVTITRLGRTYGMTTKEVLATIPKIPRQFTLFSSVAILLGACCLFHAYIVECVLSLLGYDVTNAKYRMLVAVATGVLVFLISIPRSLKILFVASSYGIVIIGFCLLFICIKSFMQISTNNCETKLVSSYGTGIGDFGPVASLMCTLTLSFYSHSFILSLVSQATRMSKVPRNVFIAYVCAGLSYMVPSALAVAAFRNCHEFSGTFVGMFDDPFADAVRCAIIMLVLIVYPIIIFISRVQLVEMFRDDPQISYVAHLVLNLLLIAACTVVPLFNVNPTAIAAMAGVFATYWSLILPCGAFLLSKKREGFGIPRGVLISHCIIIVFAVALMVITVLTVFGLIAQASPLPASVALPGIQNGTTPSLHPSVAPHTVHPILLNSIVGV